MDKTYLGIEIGGSKLQLVTGDDTGTVLARRRLTVDPGQGGPGIRRQMEAALGELMLTAPNLRGVGVGFGGPINWRTGVIERSHQIEGWSGFGLRDWLFSRTKAPIRLDNDANVGALGEATHGAGRGYNPVFYITLGSGVGGGLAVNARIYHGAKPGEAEIGHVRLDRKGATVESRCSGWAVDAKIRRLKATDPGSLLSQLASNAARGEAKYLEAALAKGDSVARRILRETTEDLAFGLSHVVHLFHPEVIVIGGGLALLGEPLRAAVAEALPPFLMEVFSPGPVICLASLGEDAVPVGALELARQPAPESPA
ncbi:MAG: ROK family protein [Candidatus Omnitrophica bacterium]|nr:ROK family protein [Candidatus Omnitrophota bacterium]